MNRLLTFLTFNNNPAVTGYGLGVFRHMIAGETVYGHGGNVFGYSTSMLYDPEKGIAVAVMVNGDMKADNIGTVLMAAAMELEAAGAGYSDDATPAMLSLGNVRIDPTGSAVTVEYSLAQPGTIRVTLHDMLGHEVAGTENMYNEAGASAATLGTTGLPHGTYICRVQSGEKVATRKIAF